MSNWYSSKQIRQIMKISCQQLYQLKKANKLQFKKISDKKYLFKLPFQLEQTDKNVAIYARVSTSKQKKDLDNQVNMLKQYVVSNGNIINQNYIYRDIGSGMNQKRKQLNRLLIDIKEQKIKQVVISNRDRLTRFGFGYFKQIFQLYNVKITQVNLTNQMTFQQQLSNDLISIIHYFLMKFYGKRKNILKKVENDLKNL